MMDRDRKSRLWGIIATLTFHAVIVLVLLTLYLSYPPKAEEQREWPPVDSAEMLFGGEYVMLGDDPLLAENTDDTAAPSEDASAPSPEITANENSGKPAEPAPVVTSRQPSPAKTEPKPKPETTGPTKAEKEAAEKAKREAEQRKAIEERMRKTDFSGSKGTGGGKPGQKNGNSDTGATSGTPGFSLNGRTLSHYELPPRGPLGSITVTVSVNRQGKVTSARYRSGTGSAAASTAARNHCIQAALRSQFSVDENAAVTQVGTITYNFR